MEAMQEITKRQNSESMDVHSEASTALLMALTASKIGKLPPELTIPENKMTRELPWVKEHL